MSPKHNRRTWAMWYCNNCKSRPPIKQSKANIYESICECSRKMMCPEHKNCSKCGKPHTLIIVPNGEELVGWDIVGPGQGHNFIYDMTTPDYESDKEIIKLLETTANEMEEERK